jgi:hypothetical protein
MKSHDFQKIIILPVLVPVSLLEMIDAFKDSRRNEHIHAVNKKWFNGRPVFTLKHDMKLQFNSVHIEPPKVPTSPSSTASSEADDADYAVPGATVQMSQFHGDGEKEVVSPMLIRR